MFIQPWYSGTVYIAMCEQKWDHLLIARAILFSIYLQFLIHLAGSRLHYQCFKKTEEMKEAWQHFLPVLVHHFIKGNAMQLAINISEYQISDFEDPTRDPLWKLSVSTCPYLLH